MDDELDGEMEEAGETEQDEVEAEESEDPTEQLSNQLTVLTSHLQVSCICRTVRDA